MAIPEPHHTEFRLQRIRQLRDALLEARLSGVREVREQNGELVRYGSDAEMAAAIRAAEAELAAPRPGIIRFATTKGV